MTTKASEMATMYLQQIGTTVRAFESDDFDAVMQVETAAFKCPWSDEMMIRHLCCMSTEVLVIKRGSALLGYVLYSERADHMFVHRIAVSYPLCGYGGTLMSDVKRRNITSGRKYIDTLVDERDVNAQKFLSHVGFKAIDIVRGDGDQYLFRHIRGGR